MALYWLQVGRNPLDVTLYASKGISLYTNTG